MDLIDELIEKIRMNRDVQKVRFTNKFLNTVGEMCSRYGYGATKLFLMGKDDKEANILKKILNMIEERNISIEIGTLILKKLNAIKFSKR